LTFCLKRLDPIDDCDTHKISRLVLYLGNHHVTAFALRHRHDGLFTIGSYHCFTPSQCPTCLRPSMCEEHSLIVQLLGICPRRSCQQAERFSFYFLQRRFFHNLPPLELSA
jgi:hypothetical protein